MTPIDKKEQCEGCNAYRHQGLESILCGLPPIKDGVECPCVKCLVKTMCSSNNCDNFKNYLMMVWGVL